MDTPASFGTSMNDEVVPTFDGMGRLYSQEERQRIADQLGRCLGCGVAVSTKLYLGFGRRELLTNDHVYKGICLRCNWSRAATLRIPPHIIDEWKQRNHEPHTTVVRKQPKKSTITKKAPPPNPQNNEQSSSSSLRVAHPLPQSPPTESRRVSTAAAKKSRTKPGAEPCNASKSVYDKGWLSKEVPSPTTTSTSSASNDSFHETASDAGNDRKLPAATTADPSKRDDDISMDQFYESIHRQNSFNSMNSSNSNLKMRSFNMNSSFRSVGSHAERDLRDSPVKSKSSPRKAAHHSSFNNNDANNNSSNYDSNSFRSRGHKSLGSPTGTTANGRFLWGRTSCSRAAMSKVWEQAPQGVDNDDTNSSIDLILLQQQADNNDDWMHVGSAMNSGSLSSVDSASGAPSEPMIVNRQHKSHPVRTTITKPTTTNASTASTTKPTSTTTATKPTSTTTASTTKPAATTTTAKTQQRSLVQVLKRHMGEPDKLRKSLHKLRNSSTKALMSHPELIAGLFAAVKDIMVQYQDNPRVMDVAAGVIWRLNASTNGAICSSDSFSLITNGEVPVGDLSRELLDSRAVFLVIDSLRKLQDNVSVLEWGLGALTSIACTKEGKTLIAHAGGIEAAVDVLESQQKNATVFEWVCRFLFNIIYDYEAEEGEQEQEETLGCLPSNGSVRRAIVEKNCAFIVEANGASTLVEAMKQHSSESAVLLWATRILCRLVRASRERSVSKMVLKQLRSKEFTRVARGILKKDSSELWEGTSELLCPVFSGSPDHALDGSAASCVSTIVRRMGESNHDDILLKSGCRVLAAFTDGGPEARQHLQDQNGAEKILDVMQQFADDDRVVQAGGWALWKLSTDPTFLSDPLLKRALAMFESAQQNHQDSPDVLRVFTAFTANVCDNSSTTLSDFSLPTLIRALESSTEAQTNEAACSALCCLFSRFPESIEAALASFTVLPRLPTIIGDASSSTRKHLCFVLMTMASISSQAREVFLSYGLLPAAIANLNDRTDADFVATLLELLSALVLSVDGRSFQLPAGTVQAIIGMWERNATNADLHTKGCRALRNLVTVSVEPLNVDNLVPFVTNFIDKPGSNDLLRQEACGVLWAITARYPDHCRSDLSCMMQTILGLIRSYGGLDSHLPFNREVLFVATGALACVSACAIQTPIELDCEDIDDIIGCVYKVMGFYREEVDIMSYILDAILNLSIVYEDLLVRRGIIVVVIDMMVDNETITVIQEKACAILAQFASSEDLQVNLSIVQTEGIDMLLGALEVYTSNPKIQTLACSALSHLSVDLESRLLITSMGGFQLILVAMTAHQDNLELLESACSALLALTADGEEELMMASEIVETVVQVMGRHLSCCSFQETAMGVLQNICMKGDYEKQVVGDTGGVEAVINAMIEHMGVATLVERALATLSSLSVLYDNQVRIQQAQGINAIINAMMSSVEYERVQKQGCGCLLNLATNAENSTKIRCAGGVDAILYAMIAHLEYEDLQREACRALSGLAIHVGAKAAAIGASDEEINSIIRAMKRFPKSADIQFHGCSALRNFLLSETNGPLVRRSSDDVTRLVQNAVSCFPVQCSEIAGQIIWQLA